MGKAGSGVADCASVGKAGSGVADCVRQCERRGVEWLTVCVSGEGGRRRCIVTPNSGTRRCWELIVS